MRLSELKKRLNEIDVVNFKLENGDQVPPHFHLTEMGQIDKRYIDCGGNTREESKISLQLWEANDYDHRLSANKFLNIIDMSERELKLDDLEIEVEYQGNTIGKYNLGFENGQFLLLSTLTDCLAKDNCGIPESKLKTNLKLKTTSNSCAPNSGCC